jgi:hypothetical protein
VTVAVTGGLVLLMQQTTNAVVRQTGSQLARITEHALAERADRLGEIATVFAALRGGARARDRAWQHPPLAVIVEAKKNDLEAGLGQCVAQHFSNVNRARCKFEGRQDFRRDNVRDVGEYRAIPGTLQPISEQHTHVNWLGGELKWRKTSKPESTGSQSSKAKSASQAYSSSVA